MRRMIAFSATAILLSTAAMADDNLSDTNSDTTSENLQLNAAGFLFDDSLREDGEPDRDGEDGDKGAVGDKGADDDRDTDRDSSGVKDQQNEEQENEDQEDED